MIRAIYLQDVLEFSSAPVFVLEGDWFVMVGENDFKYYKSIIQDSDWLIFRDGELLDSNSRELLIVEQGGINE